MEGPRKLPADRRDAGRGDLLRGSRASRDLAEIRDPELRRILTHVSARRRARLQPDGGSARDRLRDEPPNAARSEPVRAASSEPAPVGGRAPGTLLELRRVTDAVRILRVARPHGFDFTPGQYAELGVPGGGRNPYTIASAPDDPYLEFCIEQSPSGRVSRRLFALRPGDPVALGSRAKGDFTLVARASVHLMVATVTGIAPFRSMLRHAVQRNAWPGRFVVLHGASYADELAYRDELEDLAARFPERVRYRPSVSRPGEARNRGFTGDAGRVAELVTAVLDEIGPTTPGLQVYACGNPGMVASVRARMESLGVAVTSEVFD